MITRREIVASLTGAYRLVLRDPAGMQFFDVTIGGFWRSFFAAVIAAPGYAFVVELRLADQLAADHVMHAYLVEAAVYVVGWLAFPLAAYYLTGALDRRRQYVGYIVAYNWAGVLQMALYVVASGLAAGDLLPRPVEAAVAVGAMVAVLFYQFNIARIALDIGPAPAIGFVALDFMISLFLHASIEALQRGDFAT
jgi:hypothetical protein